MSGVVTEPLVIYGDYTQFQLPPTAATITTTATTATAQL